ncbi:MAG: winged helix-turn-helix transcriptional regulator [Methanobrevibacter millerae]|uniref:Winged helix-turn-helix transcriptional regulator n=1 Tax=Methanobrevibacter millerae TaxID=230361 RepID=A0A8T3VN89_9EURY|nr:MarR family winged helix-turn-helix transcriptional regulator [Methanobrevibacter millerae]MBE6505694.1 winged helix-turn-helix transcriptional regulator [Methanobrevibacter millerae]
MIEEKWNDNRIILTPINLYMEYVLLTYNNYLKEKLDDVSITHGELTYIYNIKYYPLISQRELAETLFVSEANVAKMIKKLVQKGLVKREKDKNNKSRNILSLTEKGEEIFVKINVLTCAWERDITKKLSNEDFFDLKQKLYLLTQESADL